MQSPFARRSPSDGGDFPSEGESTGLDALHTLEMPSEHTQGTLLARLPLPHPSQHQQQPPRSTVKDEGFDLHLPFASDISSLSSVVAPSVSPHQVVRNSITAVSLGAAGMRPLLIEVDRYAPPSSASTPSSLRNYPPPVSIHIKLSLSSLHDVSSPPALHGFSGTVTFAAPWTSVAQCVTRVIGGGVCESVEYAYFEPAGTSLSPLSMTPVTVPLPESELSRCRWGNIGEYHRRTPHPIYQDRLVANTCPCTGVETRIDQLVTVDHEELAWITYDLTWTASGPPTAEVLSVQRDSREQHQQQHPVAPTPLPEPASFLTWNPGTSYVPSYASYVPRSQEPLITYSPYSSLGGSSSGDQHYTHYPSSVLFS